MKLLSFAKIKSLPYPVNLLTDLNIKIPDDADISSIANVIRTLVNSYNPRDYEILISIYENKDSMQTVAQKQNISYERVRQIKKRFIRFLNLPDNRNRIQNTITNPENKQFTTDVWTQIVRLGDNHISPDQIPNITKYLRKQGVLFPTGEEGSNLIKLIDPQLTKQYTSLKGISIYEMISTFNLGFDNNTYFALYRAGITNLKSLLSLSGWGIYDLKCIGETRVNKIVTRLAELGIQAQHLMNKRNRLSPYFVKKLPIPY